jgi:hypothetical protein
LREGFDIAYGGDLRGGGFAENLSDDTGTVVLGPRFVSYLGWPFADRLTTARIADTLGLCRYVAVEAGCDVDGIEPFDETPESSWAMAQATTNMRRALFDNVVSTDIDGADVRQRVAQVLIAGKARGFFGKMPGVAEEAVVALEHGLAVYIVGAFGGAASLLAETLIGGAWPRLLTYEAHLDDPAFARMLRGAELAEAASEPRRRFDQLRARFESIRPDLGRLDNGLTDAENRELMTTCDIGKVCYLVRKGLRSRRARMGADWA